MKQKIKILSLSLMLLAGMFATSCNVMASTKIVEPEYYYDLKVDYVGHKGMTTYVQYVYDYITYIVPGTRPEQQYCNSTLSNFVARYSANRQAKTTTCCYDGTDTYGSGFRYYNNEITIQF